MQAFGVCGNHRFWIITSDLPNQYPWAVHSLQLKEKLHIVYADDIPPGYQLPSSGSLAAIFAMF